MNFWSDEEDAMKKKNFFSNSSFIRLVILLICVSLFISFYFFFFFSCDYVGHRSRGSSFPSSSFDGDRASMSMSMSMSMSFTRWPSFSFSSSRDNKSECIFPGLRRSLSDLRDNLNSWSNSSSSSLCRSSYSKFSAMYSVWFREGEIRIPRSFVDRVSNWFNHDERLVSQLNHQRVIHLFNEFSREHSCFSPLRARRPQPKGGDVRRYVQDIVRETKTSCDFCHYETQTSEDVFGRIRSEWSVSAANTLKVDRWHSLIIPDRHDPFLMDEDRVVDLFAAAKLWFRKVHSMEKQFKYPWILWDNMPHAGASQVHPHLHVGLSQDIYVGIYENIRLGAQKYFHRFGTNFFTDLIEIHRVLGLSVDLEDAVAIAQLTSRKDTEITIVSAEPGNNFFRLIFHTIQTFYQMGFYDFSSMAVFPSMTSSSEEGSLPAIIRIASRGDVASIKSEISSFELFQFSNINVDPYVVIDALRKSLLKDKHTFNSIQ